MTFTQDIDIHENDPGVLFDASEAKSVYFEDREVDGVMYRVRNAKYVVSSTLWEQKDVTQASFALAHNPDGSVSFLTKQAGQLKGWATPAWVGTGVRGTFNVRDFGAKGDGTTDDTVAIQAAASALATLPNLGGQLYFPAGTYLVSTTILLPSNCTVSGEGAQFTTMLCSANFAGAPTKYEVPGPSLVVFGNSNMANNSPTPVQSNIFIRNMGFNGNGTAVAKPPNNPGSPIFFRQVQNCGVYDCEIVNGAGDAITVLGNDDPSSWPPPINGASADIINFKIVRNHINLLYNPSNPSSPPPWGPGLSGFPIICRGANVGIVAHNVTGELTPAYYTNDSCDVPGCQNVVISDNSFFYGGDGIGTNSATDVIIDHNFVQNCQGYGIAAFASAGSGTSRLIISDNVIENPKSLGIRVTAPADNAVISGNTITYSHTTGAGAISLEVGYVNCHHNTIDLCGTASTGINCNASNLIVDSNYVFDGATPPVGSSTGINIVVPQSGLKITNNNLAGTQNALAFGTGQLSGVTASAIRNNDGVNPYVGEYSVNQQMPASGVTLANPLPFDCMVYIKGGTAVTVTVNSVATGLGSGTGYLLPTGGTIRLTYTTPPTWEWVCN